jgi:acetyltransferase-like isoleucine patch superfamily enzyme
MENIFFNISDLKSCGKNVIIGKTVRIRYPHLVSIGDNVIIDDFCYISTALEIGNNVHISSGCKVIGGKDCKLIMEDFSTFSPNVVIAAGSDDYMAGIATPLVPAEYKGNVEYGTTKIGRHCIVGSGSVLLPNVTMKTGSAVGALSLVKTDLEEWFLYAGVPAKKIRQRDQKSILNLENKFIQNDRK